MYPLANHTTPSSASYPGDRACAYVAVHCDAAVGADKSGVV
jgi:hypothetical protein